MGEKKAINDNFFFSTSDLPDFQMKMKRHAGAWCF